MPPKNDEPPPQQLKRRIKIMIVEQLLPLFPPKKPLFDEQPEPPQKSKIRIKNKQLFPPKPLLLHPQFVTSHINNTSK